MGAAVILGGEALNTQLRSQLIYSAFGDRMIHMAEFARRFALKAGVPGAISASSSRAVGLGTIRATAESLAATQTRERNRHASQARILPERWFSQRRFCRHRSLEPS